MPDTKKKGGLNMNRKNLKYFRVVLEKQRAELGRKSDGVVARLLTAAVHAADPLDRAALELERGMAVHMMERDRKLMLKIQKGLQKIDDGTFGICEECGADIDINRLKLRPVTELCIGCKTQQEKTERLTCEQD
jgi:DnaK suppressor protein